MHIRRMNRLIREKSPYLLQHAYNPVDWYPWGAEAFFRARTEDKPLFLSIGYSSCHWCHVMERESFENEQIAAILNEYFVPVKVDREERPDVDEIYITAVQLITGSAGWPLSVFLTPDGEPFYGGTYFPPAVFADLLRQVAYLWRTQRAQVLQTARELTDDLRALLSVRTREMRGERNPAIFRTFLARCLAGYDPEHGGFGDAPKFPPNTVLPVLLWMAEEWGSEEAGVMALHTLNKMAEGGIHDHIGGGFHRYATDVHWRVPHFEKMLYDNAQLAWAYTRAYTLTVDPEYADVAHNILQWMIREMRTEEGAFASALDADSPEGEGAFYTWTQDEIYSALDAQTAATICQIYNVQPEGNYREEATGRQTGRNILYRRDSWDKIAELLGLGDWFRQGELPEEVRHLTIYLELRDRLKDAHTQLLEVRSRRPAPARDSKVLTDWNGLAISVFAHAADALEHPAYWQVAETAAEFIWQRMRDPQGNLLHRYCDGEASIPAYLSDYALYGLGLVSLFEATGDLRWLERAVQLADQLIEKFHDPELGGFFETTEAHDLLIVRHKSVQDRQLPSGNGAAAQLLASLSHLLIGEDPRRSEHYATLAGETINAFWQLIERVPSATSSLLYAYLTLEGDTIPKPDLEMDTRAIMPQQEGPVQVQLAPQPEGLMVLFHIQPGWHIQAAQPTRADLTPTRVEVQTDLPIEFGEPIWLPPEPYQVGEETLMVYRGQAAVLIPIVGFQEGGSEEGYLRVRVVYQPCTDTECALPVERQFLLPVSLLE
ncbi:MAG: DUF255 domain-containing protein [Armatimonadota bacterium]